MNLIVPPGSGTKASSIRWSRRPTSRAFTAEAAYAGVRTAFVGQVQPLLAAGAEVVIPAGGLPMLLFARECPFVIDGAVMLNGIAASPECMDEFLSTRW